MLLSQAADALAGEATHWIVLDAGTVTAAGTPAQLAGVAELEALGRARARVLPPVPAPAAPYPTPGAASPPRRPRHGSSRREASRHGGARSVPGRVRLRPACRRSVDPAPALVLRDVDFAVRSGEIVAVTGTERGRQVDAPAALQRTAAAAGRGACGSTGADIAGCPGGGRLRPRWACCSSIPVTSSSNGPSCGKSASGSGSSAARPAPRAGPGGAGGRRAGRRRRERHPAELPASAAAAAGPGHGPGPRSPPCWPWTSPPWRWTGTASSHAGPRRQRGGSRGGTAVVLVTHDLAYARATAHRILRLDAGSLREIDPCNVLMIRSASSAPRPRDAPNTPGSAAVHSANTQCQTNAKRRGTAALMAWVGSRRQVRTPPRVPGTSCR